MGFNSEFKGLNDKSGRQMLQIVIYWTNTKKNCIRWITSMFKQFDWQAMDRPC